jgi:hypothetical protein
VLAPHPELSADAGPSLDGGSYTGSIGVRVIELIAARSDLNLEYFGECTQV